MTNPTYQSQVAATNTQNNLAVTLPAGIQGGDLILFLKSTRDSTLTPPGGYSTADARTIGADLYGGVYYKIAAGTVGSPSADASSVVTWTVAVTGSGHRNGLACIIIRGVDPAAPINDIQFTPYTSGGVSFPGPSATSTVDDVLVVSGFVDKNSFAPLTITAPSGYTKRSEALFSTGSGVPDASIAAKNATAAGNYGADTWTTGAIPGSVGVWTVLIAPVPTIQTAHPTSDVTVTNVTGVTNNTAGQTYQNEDEGALNTGDYNEFIATGVSILGYGSVSDPGVDTGFTITTVFRLGSGATSASFAMVLKQGSTTIESWTVTVTADGQVDTHTITTPHAATIDYSTNPATNLRVSRTLTSVS
jgi:hypothetical protein